MTADTTDLLLLRLDVLESDIAKVSAAVDRAEQRGQFLRSALDTASPHAPDIRAVSEALESLNKGMEREPRIPQLLDDYRRNLARDLREASELLMAAAQGVDESVACLKEAKRMSVILNDEGLRALRTSLKQRCELLRTELIELREAVSATATSHRRGQWEKYQVLLDDAARPVFIDYVDFLGGLTVRDTGLDDQVCDMTDQLLARYTGLIKRSLPLPARQAALGNVLDSVVLLGFPEWSIWGIPLVGHEVGMAYLRNKTDPDLLDLARQFVSTFPSEAEPVGEDKTVGDLLKVSRNLVLKLSSNVEASPEDEPVKELLVLTREFVSRLSSEQPRPTEQYVHHLIADAFATYTLGLSYASAALVLRLSPRHDEPLRSDNPRDIERARVIMATLLSRGENAPASGGSFSDSVGTLKNIWEAALRAHAGPRDAGQAALEADPQPTQAWLDQLSVAAVEHFSGLMQIRPYDNERWQGSEKWIEPLKFGRESPDWQPYDNVIPDVLTAAWRLRLRGEAPSNLAENIKLRWATRQRRG